MKIDKRVLAVAAAVGFAAMARLIPHPPNFTPILAMALFAGAKSENRGLAIGLPLIAMLLSDALLGFHSAMPVVYLALAGVALIGRFAQSPKQILFSGVAGVALFFLVTNFAVWAFGTLYTKDISGLVASYIAAIPFVTNTAISTGVYSLLLFGGFHIAEDRIPAIKGTPAIQ